LIKVSPGVATAVPSRASRNYAPGDRGGYTFSDFIKIKLTVYVPQPTSHIHLVPAMLV